MYPRKNSQRGARARIINYKDSALLRLAGVLLLQLASTNGETLQGTVRDPSGHLIQAASVSLSSKDVAHLERTALTDAAGRFVFAGVARGLYRVYAMKKADGLPDVSFAFFAIGQPWPQEVDVDDVVKTIVLDVGQPDGRIDGTVRDPSGRPISGAQYRLAAQSDPGQLIISGADRNGEIDTLVPGVPIVLTIEAVGFKALRLEPMLVKSGETKRLNLTVSR